LKGSRLFSLEALKVPHGFGTKYFGYRELEGLKLGRILELEQVHGKDVLVLRKGDPIPPPPLPYDGVLTDRKGLVLVIRTADCAPVLLWDPKKEIIGALHCGWRGILAGIIGEAIKALQKAFDSSPQDLIVAIGPMICKDCYQIGLDLVQKFTEKYGPEVIYHENGQNFLRLNECIRKEAQHYGIKDLHFLDLCTCCNEHLFYSYRRSSTSLRQLNFIAL